MIFGQLTLEKPQCGENQWERGSSSYFFNFWKLHFSKNKTNRILTYLFLDFRAWNWLEDTPNQPPQKLCSDSRTVRTVTALNAVRFCWKTCPELTAAVRRSYDLYGPLNAPFFLVFVPLYGQNRYNKFCCTKIRTIRIYFSYWLPRNLCPSFALEIVPLLCCFLFLENRNFSFSCSLSISQSLLERMTSHLVFFLL